MKFLITALFGLLTFSVGAQSTTTFNYATNSTAINNPERGFYRHTEVHSTNYTGLDQTTLNSYKSSNTTLLLRVFYLENFITSPISSSYLNAMQADFNKIRIAGLKCIVRFAYSDNTNGKLDASKAQILAHIAQLKPLLVSNVDIISSMQAGFIGTWGEWYYTDYFGMNPNATDYANRKEVVDALLSALPDSRMVQIRTPSLKQKTYNSTTALSQSQAFNKSNMARIGHHNDCFLASANDFGTYNNTSTEYSYLEQETKFTPMGGETCAVNEPRSQCPTALAEMQKFHWSYLNFDYHPTVISGFQSNNCFPEIQNRLGYRLELVNGTYPNSATIGESIALTLKIKNSGFASPFNERIVYLILRNTSTKQEYSFALATDPRFWSSGVQQTITESIQLPSTILSGSYQLFLSLPDSSVSIANRPEYAIRFANDATWESTTGYNNLLHTLTINNNTLGVVENQKSAFQLYPNPTDKELIIACENSNDLKVSAYNMLGQAIKLESTCSANKTIVNTEGLSEGIYLIKLESNSVNETKKIIVKH
jgi:hypothetical protein